MKLASYNVENLFLRARAFNEENAAKGKEATQKQLRLNRIFAKDVYTAVDKKTILELLDDLGLLKDDNGGAFAILRQNKGKLVTRHNDGTVSVKANGRSDWIGWVDLKTEEVNEVATRATARVIADVDADILAVVEVESRPALVRFSAEVMTAQIYRHIMVIDGNDERGIDVGIMTKPGYEITSMVSHVDDEDAQGQIFSRDCAAYTIKTPKNNRLTVLVNHFKSQLFGDGQSDAKRLRQATRVKEIYERLLQSGKNLVAVVGDLNVRSESQTLAPLLAQTNLREIGSHPDFDDGDPNKQRPGTHRNGTADDKLDYILLSPALFEVTKRGGIFRKGVWGGIHGTLFEHYPEITKESEAASDHAAIWAEMDV